MASPAVALENQLPPVSAKPAVDPELQRLQQQVANQGAVINNLQNQMRPPAQAPAPPTDKKAAEKEFFSDPIRATVQIAQDVAQAISNKAQQDMGPSYETLKETAINLVRQKDPELFNKYEAQIRASVASVPNQFHTNVQTWELAFNKVKGEYLRDIIAASKTDSNRGPAVHVSNSGGPAAPTSREGPAAASAKLSDGEKEVARNLGISEDQYQKGKDHIAGQQERGKSSWDPYITFSSTEKRRQESAKRRASNSRPAAA